jgi:lipopolysaccharide heptosyltransferase I
MNIAVVKLSSLGDVVHALPVAAALRRAFPRARLAWLVERREAALLRGNPLIDEVLCLDTRRWRQARDLTAVAEAGRALGQVWRQLRQASFDVALDLQGLLKSGLLTAATGARLRIGFAARRCREPLNALFTNRRVSPPPSARHVVDQLLALVEPLGVRDVSPEFWLPAQPEAEAWVDRFLAATGLKPKDRLVVLNPGAGRSTKRWPTPHFVELARRLAAEAGAVVLVVWGPAERELAQTIVDEVGHPCAVLVPPTDLHGLLAVLRRGSVVVAADTGPLHLAAAVGTPCVGLYGPTAAERNGPYGAGHRVVQSPDGAMTSLTPALVLPAVMASLE